MDSTDNPYAEDGNIITVPSPTKRPKSEEAQPEEDESPLKDESDKEEADGDEVS
jgi:hypothetical protein